MGRVLSQMTIRRMLALGIAALLVLVALMGVLLKYLFSEWTRAKADENFHLISGSIEHRLEDVVDRIEWTAKTISYSPSIQTYLLSDDPGRVIELSASAVETLSVAIDPMPIIRNISFIAANSRRLEYAHMPELLRQALSYYGFSDSVRLEQPFFSRIFYIQSGAQRRPYIYYFFPVKCVLPPYVATGVAAHENFAICAVLWDISATTADVIAPLVDQGVFAFIGDDILSASAELTDAQRQALVQAPIGFTSQRADGGRELRFSEQVTDLGVRFACVVSEASLTHELMPIIRMGYALLLLPTCLVVLLVLGVVHLITRPVRRIIDEMRDISDYDGGARVHVPATPDVALLARGINGMLGRISAEHAERMKLQEQVLRAQIDRHQAELLSYRSQVNPHFLFNTLECIRSMAQARSFDNLEQILGAMTGMFQYSLNARPIVSLRRELEHARNYFGVISMRSPGRYLLKTAISDDALECPIHAMVLQPLIENAVTHAFKNKRPPCAILVQGWVDEQGLLRLRIADNGLGIEPERLAQIERALDEHQALEGAERTSIGLVNIFRRLRYTFGEDCHLSVRSRPGRYTCIELAVPNVVR